MLRIKGAEITLTRGDTARIELAVTKDGRAYDFSDDTVLFTVKRNTETAEILIQKESVDGVIAILPADTDGLAYGPYVYDVQLTTAGGDVCTVIPPSPFNLAPEVTWAAAQS